MISLKNYCFHLRFWLQHVKLKLKKFWLVRYIFIIQGYQICCLGIIHISDFEPNTFHDLEWMHFHFPSEFHICYSLGRCVFQVIYMHQKSQRSSSLRWNSLRLFVSHYICLWAAGFCGQIWSTYFKLVHATIWRNGFQPKHLINSESRWPCLLIPTWKCWTQWQSEDECTCILDQVPAPSHLVMITPDLIFTILSRSILLHSIWRQAIDTWEKRYIFGSKYNLVGKICLL